MIWLVLAVLYLAIGVRLFCGMVSIARADNWDSAKWLDGALRCALWPLVVFWLVVADLRDCS